ncbi:hypothetical protein ACGFMM_11895 [Streptomyces sp. NPDC048604]|uniref:hypothetical protein n=1 Tax=Streptomyces sp. NPDC048604 TaxID=3365578 RepID=UPI00371A8B8D
MRAFTVSLATATALLVLTAPARAAETTAEGWVPSPTPSYSFPAGTRCDFPVRTEPVVDEVVRNTIRSYEDDSPRLVAYRGDLVVRVTNTETGAYVDADAGGRALVEIRPDRSQFWQVSGPILAGFGENAGTLPRGLYTIDGTYTLEVSAAGRKTLTMAQGTTEDLCERIG